jgi:hypothetical protein
MLAHSRRIAFKCAQAATTTRAATQLLRPSAPLVVVPIARLIHISTPSLSRQLGDDDLSGRKVTGTPKLTWAENPVDYDSLVEDSTSTIHPSRPAHGTEIPIEEVRDKPIRQPASGGSDGLTKTSRDSPGSGRVGKRRVPMVDPVTEEMTEEEVDENEAAVDKMKETVKETAAKVSEAAKGTIDQMKSAASSAMNKATDAVKEAASTAASAGSRALHDGVSPGKQGFMGSTSTAQMNSSRLGSEDRKLDPVEQLIVKDHAIIKLLYSEYTDAIDVQVKQRKVFALIHEMARHNAQEELVVYPFLRTDTRIPNGATLAERSIAEHEQLNVDVKTLDRLASDISVPQFTVMLSETMEAFLKHVTEEEEEILPLLVQHLSRSERLNLGEHFSNAATLVTTRPHPMAPKEGPAAVAAHLASKPLDLMRDIMAGREDAIKREAAEATKKVEGAMAAQPSADV